MQCLFWHSFDLKKKKNKTYSDGKQKLRQTFPQNKISN